MDSTTHVKTDKAPSRAAAARRFLEGTFPENRRPLDSWHQIITGMAEDMAMVEIGTDEEHWTEGEVLLVAFDIAAVAGFALGVTAPRNAAQLKNWAERAKPEMDLENWPYLAAAVAQTNADAHARLWPQRLLKALDRCADSVLKALGLDYRPEGSR